LESLELCTTVAILKGRLIIDIRPQNLLLTFESKAITVRELLASEKSGEQYGDRSKDIIHEDPSGVAVIYASRPLALVADGEPLDLCKMRVKIADFGKGSPFLNELTDSNIY